MSITDCAHLAYLEVTGETNDTCTTSLRTQSSDTFIREKHPLIDRPHQTIFIPKYEDAALSTHHGYPSKLPGLGSCDCLAFRVCIACHQVIGLPRKTLNEWEQLLDHAGDCSDDDDESVEDVEEEEEESLH